MSLESGQRIRATVGAGMLAPVALVAMTLAPPAGAQNAATTAATQSPETDIGRVSTGAGPAETAPAPVAPGATTTREAAVEEKRDAFNMIEVQPLSEIVKLPDINMAEALQRLPGISLDAAGIAPGSGLRRPG